MSDKSIVSHNKYDKGHYYEDKKYPKESFVCDDCYLSISEVNSEFQFEDDLRNGTVFNKAIRG